MADKAHIATDKEIIKMEELLSDVYSRANKELTEKAETFFKQFEEQDKKYKALVDAGEMTEKQYKAWRKEKLMTGKHWTAMKEQTAQELLKVNQTAAQYINGGLSNVYAINYNFSARDIEYQTQNAISFELVDKGTVEYVAKNIDKSLLPYKQVDPAKDIPWNTRKFNGEVLQGIIQGESIKKIARRIQNVTNANQAAAVRSARTVMNTVQNKARFDAADKAADKGVVMAKCWIATKDDRTRDWHMQAWSDYGLKEKAIPYDEPFIVNGEEMMFPGDTSASPSNIYNCRCDYADVIQGFKSILPPELQGKIKVTFTDSEPSTDFETEFKARPDSKNRDVSQDKKQLFETRNASDIGAANEHGTGTLGNIYDSHTEANKLNRVGFSDANILTQTVGADYTNLSVESANIFNRQITRLANEYDTPLQKIRTMTPQEAALSQNIFAKVSHNYSVDSAELVINPVKCKDVASLTARINELQERGYCVKVLPGREADYIATHEFAHTIIDTNSSLKQNWVNANFDKVRSARSEIESVYKDYISEVGKIEKDFKQAEFDFIMGSGTREKAIELKGQLNDIKLSNYSMTNADEFLAESFTNQKIGVASNPYAERVVSVLDKYFGR